MGAKNAGHLAVAILAVSDPELRGRLKTRRERMTAEVLDKGKDLPRKLRELLDRRG